ncbi:hypothetical protein LTR91_007297 [Friedmanniomyces endolithicus]|uniref:Uncharacterized protein n=1 Tax=Friedmanniomyces endolithicus TaxID=329885 RepID=A0AAN6KQ27_9PEZI|nr:hypothetical protein LTR94_002814 [Friedmanniomyces endolithicus]KAK0800199.1 hypothetical protein LTR75_008993 [Friedmanniomyces endolithicus]KAK0805684.1 hypothetical protein LTR59_003906 [Friedmanniomyces endolithicus]KAK0809825.1 hypothetical protein LTR38_004155 [Friedmanniomyces endolithicus]KAK0848900.1 hypothetical protein LTR03_005465 [Friedmanniomyces endolithicus]
MAEGAPIAAGPGDGGSQISTTSLSEALGALEIASSAALPRSASPADSGVDEVGAAQLLNEKAGLLNQDAEDANAESRKEAIEAAKRAGKKAKAEAKAERKSERKAAKEAAKKAKAARYASIREYFDVTYENKQDKLAAWQLLCEHVGVEPGSSIVECKKALKEVFINIWDFVAFQKGGPPFKRFHTAKELREYTIRYNKVFKLEEAKERPMLRSMLIKIWSA